MEWVCHSGSTRIWQEQSFGVVFEEHSASKFIFKSFSVGFPGFMLILSKFPKHDQSELGIDG